MTRVGQHAKRRGEMETTLFSFFVVLARCRLACRQWCCSTPFISFCRRACRLLCCIFVTQKNNTVRVQIENIYCVCVCVFSALLAQSATKNGLFYSAATSSPVDCSGIDLRRANRYTRSVFCGDKGRKEGSPSVTFCRFEKYVSSFQSIPSSQADRKKVPREIQGSRRFCAIGQLFIEFLWWTCDVHPNMTSSEDIFFSASYQSDLLNQRR